MAQLAHLSDHVRPEDFQVNYLHLSRHLLKPLYLKGIQHVRDDVRDDGRDQRAKILYLKGLAPSDVRDGGNYELRVKN